MSRGSCVQTEQALQRLLERFVSGWAHSPGGCPRQDHDPGWPSPCQIGEPDPAGEIDWRPVRRDAPADFAGVEAALEAALHPSIKAFYGSFWCDSFEARTGEGGLTIIQVWNDDDFERLCANLLGHALAERRARLPLTVFVGCTDEDEFIVSVENETGRVVLEQPGQAPTRVLDESLAEFLDRVIPVDP